MSSRNKDWSAHDLEMYIDDELDSDRRAALTGDLRKDATLRNRLTSITQWDDELRASFQAGDVEQPSNRQERIGAKVRWVLAAAACLVMTTIASVVFQPSKDNRIEFVTIGGEPKGRGEERKPAYAGVRVVFSLPVRAQDDVVDKEASIPVEHLDVRAESPDRPDEDRVPLRRMKELLTSGDFENTAQFLRSATDKQRSEAFAAIGELLRSAEVAERMLDRMSPREQLAACEVWARTPAFRALVFERLRQLSAQPEFSGDVQAVLTSFEGEPTLRKWLRASQLRT